MKKRVILLLIIALNLCSCMTRSFHNIDNLPYLLRMEIFVNGEKRSYELLHDARSKYYNSTIQLNQAKGNELKARLDFLFTSGDVPIDRRLEDLEFEIVYTSKDSCFIDGKQYQLTVENVRGVYPRAQLEEGWFSLCLPQDSESGIAYSIVFDMSFTPYDGYKEIKTLSGIVEVTKDFMGYKNVTYVTNRWGKIVEIRAPHWNGEGLIKKE